MIRELSKASRRVWKTATHSSANTISQYCMYGWEIVGGFQCARIDCVLCCSIALQHHQFNRRKRFVYVRTYTKLTACGWIYKLSCSLSNIYMYTISLIPFGIPMCSREKKKKRDTDTQMPISRTNHQPVSVSHICCLSIAMTKFRWRTDLETVISYHMYEWLYIAVSTSAAFQIQQQQPTADWKTRCFRFWCCILSISELIWSTHLHSFKLLFWPE